jgi:hypothetical protein
MISMKGITALMLLVAAASCGGESEEDPGSSLGLPCDSYEACGGGMSCDTNDAPTAGMCTSTCSSSAQCESRYGEGAFCIGDLKCVRACTTALDCREDQFCFTPDGWCKRKYCTGNDHCYGFRCNLQEGVCYTSCSSNEQCNVGYYCPVDLSIFECIELY